ncbi:hypothetical protein EV715DRAFT_297655 [Schizophyllum commune]
MRRLPCYGLKLARRDILKVNLDDTSDTPPAGTAPATSPSSSRPDLSDSLRRHIHGPNSLAHRSRASHNLFATNDSALDTIARNTTTLLLRTDDVLRAIEQTSGILVQGFERLTPAVSQGGIDLAGSDVDPNSLPPGLRPEPPEVIGQAAPAPISLPPDQCHASYGEGPHSLFDQSARVALSAVMRSPEGHQIDREASDATDGHPEELAADRLTPASSSLPSDLSHSPRTSLLSDDPSAPHSTPNAGPEAEAGQQPGVFFADAGASLQGDLSGPSSSMQDGSLPGDAGAQSRDGANGGPSNALRCASEQERDPTHIHCHDVLAKEGPYIGRKLLIRVGKKSQLQDSSSQPFSQGVNTLLHVIEARRHDLTQLQLEIHQVLVSGGTFDGGDALESLLYAIRPHLHFFFICSVSFKIAASHDMNLDDTSDTPPAGPASAAPPLTRSRNFRDSLIRHIAGLRSLLTRRSRASHDTVATNSPALDIIAHNTTAALTREGEWEDVPASVGEQQGTSTAQDADGGQQASSSRDVGGSSYLSSPHSSEESSPSDRPAHAATDAMAANSPRHYHEVEASEAASTDDHSEGLTPSPSSFSYDSEHSPRTSLLSGDISVPHSTPNVASRSEAGQQQSSTSAENASPSLATVDATSTSDDHAEPADGRISDRSDNHDGSDDGPGVAQAAADVDLTCLWFETKVQAGAFVDRKLLIRVGKRSQLRDPSAQPFTEGLSDVVDVCEASQLPLKEISLEVYASTVRGGESDGKDALIQTLLRLVPHLGNLTVASVKSHVDDGAIDSSNTAAQERQSIRMAMSRLHHVRLEGATTLTRLQIFPLEKLHILEILTEVTEATVEALPLLCSRLAVLVAGPVIPDDESGSDMPGLLGRAAQAQLATFPSVLRLISAHSCERLLASLPRDSTTLDFTLTNGNCLKTVRKFFDGNPMRSLRLA